MHTFMRAIALIAVLAVSSTQALADMVKDSGSIDAAYLKRDAQPISEDHQLVLSESSGTSANPDGLVDGFAVSIKDVVDLRQGNGTQHGYVVYIKGSERQVVKIDGAVTTVMQDGQPKSTFKGNYTIAAGDGTLGIDGEGTYSGYFTAEDKFHVDWEGTRTVQKNAVASPGNN
jgi:archaellum component FlaG (FlaF/FlaG flagellin family)